MMFSLKRVKSADIDVGSDAVISAFEQRQHESTPDARGCSRDDCNRLLGVLCVHLMRIEGTAGEGIVQTGDVETSLGSEAAFHYIAPAFERVLTSTQMQIQR